MGDGRAVGALTPPPAARPCFVSPHAPPYLHDGRLLTLEDTVEYFNLILGVKLSVDEKVDLVAFLRQL